MRDSRPLSIWKRTQAICVNPEANLAPRAFSGTYLQQAVNSSRMSTLERSHFEPEAARSIQIFSRLTASNEYNSPLRQSQIGIWAKGRARARIK